MAGLHCYRNKAGYVSCSAMCRYKSKCKCSSYCDSARTGMQCKRLVGVKASSDAANMDIILIFDDGSEWELNEAELRKLV